MNDENLKKIQEIMELLAKKGIGKDWILHEMMRYRLTEKALHEINTLELLKACPVDFLSRILSELRGIEFPESDSISNIDQRQLEEKLLSLGMTKNQCRVYIYLLKCPLRTASQISKDLRLLRTETYPILTNLQNRGIISATFQHPILFEAVAHQEAITALSDKQKEKTSGLDSFKEVLEIWSSIPNLPVKNEPSKEKLQLLEGVDQMAGKIKELLSVARKSIKIFTSEKMLLAFYHADLLDLISQFRGEVQIVASTTMKNSYVFEGKLLKKVKNMPRNLRDDTTFIIIDNKHVILLLDRVDKLDILRTMYTNNSKIAILLNTLFEYVWSNSGYLQKKSK